MAMPDKEGQVVLYNRLNLMVDSVCYNSSWHFAFLADQNGVSLERLNAHMESNDKNTWHSAASSVAYASPGAENSQISVHTQKDWFFALNSRSLSPDMDGFEDLLILRYKFPEADYLSTIKIFNIEGKEMKTLINNKTLGTDGAIVWDGTGQNAEVLPIGVYLVLIECLSPSGELRREKLSILLAESL
jgi:flagellar hook assembly protein FlgD